MAETTVEKKELEYSVVGAILIDSQITGRISGVLSPDDFSIGICRAIYNAGLDALAKGNKFDAVTALNALPPDMDRQSGRQFIVQCMETTPTVANAEYHAQLLHDKAAKGRLAAAIMAEAAEVALQTGVELCSHIMGICQDFLKNEQTGKLKSLCEALGEMYIGQKERNTLRIDTGLSRTDGILKGICGGNLCIVGARPGVGKSAFALQLAEQAALTAGRVLIYSMEMTADELAERFVARRSGIPLDAIIDGTLTEEQQKLMVKASAQLSTLPISINDAPNMTVAKIRAEALALPDLKLIIVDFLSLMQPGRKYENRNLELGAMSRELKNLAAELKIPIVALAQLNRGTSDEEVPSLRSLRDSGELEQNANKILLLWNIDKEQNHVGLFVAKNRRGRTGSVKLHFDGAHMSFTEIDYIHDNELKPQKPQRETPPW